MNNFIFIIIKQIFYLWFLYCDMTYQTSDRTITLFNFSFYLLLEIILDRISARPEVAFDIQRTSR